MYVYYYNDKFRDKIFIMFTYMRYLPYIYQTNTILIVIKIINL